MKYIRDLSNVDDKVRSVSPQINKDTRPFIGILIICDKNKYCVPLSSPKPKHKNMKNDKDFTKIFDKHDKLIGVLDFNLMIPVDEKVISVVNINVAPIDRPDTRARKNLMKDQLFWCRQNQEAIVNKANKLYRFVTETPKKSLNLTRRCCDFKKLEKVLQKYISKKAERVEDKEALSQPKDVRGFIKKKAQEISKQPHKEQPSKSKDKNSQSR